MSNPSLHPEGWFDNGFKNKKMLSCNPTVEEPSTHILNDYLSATDTTLPHQRVQGHVGNRLLATRILTEQKSAVDTSLACIHAFNVRFAGKYVSIKLHDLTVKKGPQYKSKIITNQKPSMLNKQRKTGTLRRPK